jgi:hypothetical protein
MSERVDSLVKKVGDLVNMYAHEAKLRAAQALDRLSQPYCGALDDPQMLYAMPAGGYADPGVVAVQERGFAPDRQRKNRAGKNRDAFFSRTAEPQPQDKGAAVMDWGSTTLTCSNHVEAAGSSSLTGASNWMVWASDFEHEGL